MNFIWVMVVAFIVYKITWHNFFSWKTIVTKLWKNIFKKMSFLASLSDDVYANIDTSGIEKSINVQGDVINAILKHVNYHKAQDEGVDECDEDFEEETFGYGYFDFGMVLINMRNQEEEIRNQKGQS